MPAAKPIPDGYHAVTPYLYLRNCKKALEWYAAAFGAETLFAMPTPTGGVGHAEFKIGDSIVMCADEAPAMGASSPQTLNGTTFGICLYVNDCDAIFKRAVAAGGATVLRELKDQFYGDRSGTLKDPFGHVWTVATHKEDLSPEEIGRRAAEAMKSGGCG